MKRIGVIHATVNSVEPLEAEFNRLAEEYEIINFVDENMLKRIKHENGITSQSKREFAKLVFRALDAKVDAIVIACTVYCPLVSLVQEFTDVPVIAIDMPMMEKAVQLVTHIGVLATNTESGHRTMNEIYTLAEKLGKSVFVETLIYSEAYGFLKSGLPDEHDKILLNGARKLKENGAELVILAQVTMSRSAVVIEKENIKVLTSPAEGVRRVIEHLE